MATQRVFLPVLAALLLAAAAVNANDVPVRFCVVDCEGSLTWPKAGVKVQLGGCVDEPATCTTGADGCCIVDPSTVGHRQHISYCNGAAGNYCNWNIIEDDNGPYVAEPQAFMRNGSKLTPKEFSCCYCNGQDYCNPVIYSDAGSKECSALKAAGTSVASSGPFTVTFKSASCHSGCTEAKKK